MRCNQELYGHINCNRDVILGEKYCKFHFVPSLRVEIGKLQAENAKLRECVEFYADTGNWYAVDCDPLYGSPSIVEGIIDFSDIEDSSHGTEIRYGGKRARQALKELEEK